MEWTRGRALGHGSTATVSLATSPHSDQVFAVKSSELIRSEFLQKEQKILSSISSPYIVSYMGCDITREDNRVMYNLFLEYMSGGTLSDVIREQGGRLDELAIGRYTSQILQGLDYLHSIGVVHCDIKGRNILVGQGGGSKIADFGCARRVNRDDETVTVGGTPMFMAPEVARGEEQGFASDIWGLGCTVIEMATGGAPWTDAKDPVSVIYKVGYSDEVPEIPCCLSEEARDFLDKCLKRDPKERWTASQLVKHPFLVQKFVADTKQIQESKASTSSSPTSILDQGFWNSLDESESNWENQVHPSVAEERIRRLSLVSGERPKWVDDDDEENWITVRVDDMDGKDDDLVSCGGLVKQQKMGVVVGSEQLLDLLGSSNSCSSRTNFNRTRKYDSFVISNLNCFENDRDMLLLSQS